MIWSTHAMAGLSTLWLFEAGSKVGLLPPLTHEQIALVAGAAALGALLPDLDASQSKIKHVSISGIKPFYLPSEMIFHSLGHRTWLHSLWGVAGIALIASAFIPFAYWGVALGIIAGYASHLALDACNPSGIPLFYPNRKKVHLLPKSLRISTGSPPEEIVFVFFALLALLFFLSQLRAI